MFPPLPIDEVLPALRDALAHGRSAVLVAPPGAGKTTRVPLSLLDTAWGAKDRILVLEPRRLAARAAATQMARLLGEEVGQTVGYRVRHESRVSARTRVEVVTEGILTRMLQDDPTLGGVSALLFDEFHERHLAADLGLALALESRQVLREELRIVVMSATLEAAPVAALLESVDGRAAPVIQSEGRAFPVETRWRAPRDPDPSPHALARRVVAAIAEGLAAELASPIGGDVLVFLPGIADLQRVRAALAESHGADGPEVHLLHGGLTLAEQDRVLRRQGSGRRVVLSTAIAESSVTLEDVRVVVDAGLARVPRFSPRSGMTRLETVRVSRASADQRRGRAGRVAPGLCLRLWSEGQHASLAARAVPEILDADLAPLALELACAGLVDATRLRWLDAPPQGALAQGRALLRDLGALDAAGRVTTHGRAMAVLGVPPRLAHLVLAGAARGAGRRACEVAALLAERDVLRREASEGDADLGTRVEALHGKLPAVAVDRARLDRVRAEADALERALPRRRSIARDTAQGGERRSGSDPMPDSAPSLGALVALAFPDRVAQRRPGDAPRFLLRGGGGARFATPQPLGASPYLAVADLDGDPNESRIWLAAPLDEDELREVLAPTIVVEREVAWDDAGLLRAVERERTGALVLRERVRRDLDAGSRSRAFLDRLSAEGMEQLAWKPAASSLRARIAFAHRHFAADFPAVDDRALLTSLEDWLGPALADARRWSDLVRLDLASALLTRLDWRARARLDAVAPTHIEVPSGSRIAIDYLDPDAPALAVKLQEVFGMQETPRVAEGRVPLTLHLLSPAQRPVQVTRDLASFWRSGYFDVRKDLKGRYPRHPWPDDPLAAPATRRVKPRGT